MTEPSAHKAEGPPPVVLDLPLDLLNELDRCLNATKWTVPIKADGAFPSLLAIAISLAKQGLGMESIFACSSSHCYLGKGQTFIQWPNAENQMLSFQYDFKAYSCQCALVESSILCSRLSFVFCFAQTPFFEVSLTTVSLPCIISSTKLIVPNTFFSLRSGVVSEI